MIQLTRLLLLTLGLLLIMISCNPETKSKNLMGLAKMVEPNFKGKKFDEQKINTLVSEYMKALNGKDFETQYGMYSQNCLSTVSYTHLTLPTIYSV